MARKVIGIILILMAIGLTAWIIVNIGSLIPHIIGPIMLTVLGVSHLISNGKDNTSNK